MNEVNINNENGEKAFHSGLTDKQIRTLQAVKRIGNQLISNCPEIADLYRREDDLKTYLEIAEQYVGETKQFPNVASRSVGYAIRRLIPKKELDEIRRKRRKNQLECMFEGFDSEQFREHCRNAARKRHELVGIGVDTDSMIVARGRTPWKDIEKKDALNLSKNPAYQHQKGQHKGKPDYGLIALELNIKYHNCEEVRYSNSVASFIRDSRRKK